jgi:hypothetical protein
MATANKVRKPSRAAKMREYFTANPLATPSEVAKKFKTTYQIAYMCKKTMEENAVKDYQNRTDALIKRRKEQRMEILAMTSSNKSVLDTINPEIAIAMIEPQPDPVNHPYHYKVGGIETIDFIEAKGLTYHLGNAVKYISRADHKGNRKQDLEKAKWYIDRAIAQA